MRTSLGALERQLAGRAHVESKTDPVLPFVSRVAKTIYAKMKADVNADREGAARAEAEWDALVEDAIQAAWSWREAGRDDLARRLEILFRREL